MWRFGAGGLFPVRPLRLVAQDIGFSVRRQGFDSPRGYLAIWQRLAPNRSSWQKGSFYRGFLCFLRFGATRCGRVLCLILCRFGGVFCICCAGFCAALGGVLDGLLIVVVRHLQIMHLGDQRRVADPFADDMQREASRQFGLAAGTHSVWLGAGPAPAAGGSVGLVTLVAIDVPIPFRH